MNRRGASYRNEDAQAAVVACIAQHGEEQGYGPPSLPERARTTGAAAYPNGLGLSDRCLHDAIGNYLDSSTVPVRLIGPLGRWLHGGDLPRHDFRSVPA
eukprot:11212249-Lingulodinium_polyedra.AAC.1